MGGERGSLLFLERRDVNEEIDSRLGCEIRSADKLKDGRWGLPEQTIDYVWGADVRIPSLIGSRGNCVRSKAADDDVIRVLVRAVGVESNHNLRPCASNRIHHFTANGVGWRGPKLLILVMQHIDIFDAQDARGILKLGAPDIRQFRDGAEIRGGSAFSPRSTDEANANTGLGILRDRAASNEGFIIGMGQNEQQASHTLVSQVD